MGMIGMCEAAGLEESETANLDADRQQVKFNNLQAGLAEIIQLPVKSITLSRASELGCLLVLPRR